MRLNDAKFCCDCEEVFEGTDCPKCGRSVSCVCLSDWLVSLQTPKAMEYLAQKVGAVAS